MQFLLLPQPLPRPPGRMGRARQRPTGPDQHRGPRDIIAAGKEWQKLKPKWDRVKNVFQEASDQAGKINIVAGPVTGGYFQPKHRPAYDLTQLARLVPADILKKCLAPRQDRREGFWMRSTNR